MLRTHKSHINAISSSSLLLLLMTLSSSIKMSSCGGETIDVSVSECRKLEVYYQCKVSNLTIMEGDKQAAIKFNIPRQPNDVRIESSHMDFIPPQFFESLVELKEFVAVNCSIRRVFYETFARASKLHYLVLSHNDIEYVADYAFRNASDLQSLKLDHNAIESLTTNVFRGLNALRTLKLSFNRIVHLPLFLFNDLDSLETLELDHNRIRIVSAQQFTNNAQLREINLNANRVTIVDRGAFDDLISLQQVSLEDNVCVNACIGGGHANATVITETLRCCMPAPEEEMRACLAREHVNNGGEDSKDGGGLSIALTLFLLVSVFANALLVAYLLGNRAWLDKLRGREETIELVGAETAENSYQGFL